MIEYEKEWFCVQIKSSEQSMYRLALSILHNQQDAEDAMQDAVCTAFNRLDSLRSREKFTPWILRIVSNASIDILRKRKFTSDIDELEIPAATGPDVNDKLTLWNAVQSLETTTRQIVVLYYYEDLSINDISKVTGITVGTVKTRLYRARQQLMKALSETVP